MNKMMKVVEKELGEGKYEKVGKGFGERCKGVGLSRMTRE